MRAQFICCPECEMPLKDVHPRFELHGEDADGLSRPPPWTIVQATCWSGHMLKVETRRDPKSVHVEVWASPGGAK